MDYYFTVITIINAFVLSIMCVFVKHNETLGVERRKWFIFSFLLIMSISALELLTVAVDEGPAVLRWVSIISNYLGFGLTPAVPIAMSCAIAENKTKKTVIWAELTYLAFLAISFPFGGVFYVDQYNHYTRGDLFGIYFATYVMSLLYLLVTTVKIVKTYQNQSRGTVFLISVFLLAGSMIQVVFPQLHITWLCATMLAMLFYVYCNSMWMQLDGLTGMLNQGSYLNKTRLLKQDKVLIVFDLDNFKGVNDTYGHQIGDECLKEIAGAIKAAFSEVGLCYRIGGDEFCVLMNVDADMFPCQKALIFELESRRKQFPMLPYVSFGAAEFHVGDDIEVTKVVADMKMYKMKKAHKSALREKEVQRSRASESE